MPSAIGAGLSQLQLAAGFKRRIKVNMHFPSHPELNVSGLGLFNSSVGRGFALSTPGQLKRLLDARRKLLGVPLDFGSEINADYFLWCQRDPVSDFLTKRGGLPFVEKTFLWPSMNGNPLTFLGQICLCDSLDLLDTNLEFDTLSVFSDSPMPTNEPGTIVTHAASRKTGSILHFDSVPENAIVLPELIGIRIRLSVFPEFRHQDIFIDGYVDYNILFPHGTYICKHVRSLQQSVPDVCQRSGISGLASWSGVDATDGIPGPEDILDLVDPNFQDDEELRSWMDLEAGAILIGVKDQQLIAEYQI